jgi:hypothetical protein
MLPSRGLCHAVFLLVRAAHFRSPANVAEWIEVARGQSTIMASALNLDDAAASMLQMGFVTETRPVSIDDPLRAFWELADRATLISIARIVLGRDRPDWLGLAVIDGAVYREYIPTAELAQLDWLGEDLDALLLDIAGRYGNRDESLFLAAMGLAGELLVVESERLGDFDPIHVSQMSDSYGYDIESRARTSLCRMEVKTTVKKNAKSFYLTRNEFEKSVRHGDEWILVQIVLSPSAVLRRKVSAMDIEGARCLRSAALRTLVPADSTEFEWIDSAKITPADSLWASFDIKLSPTWNVDLDDMTRRVEEIRRRNQR